MLNRMHELILLFNLIFELSDLLHDARQTQIESPGVMVKCSIYPAHAQKLTTITRYSSSVGHHTRTIGFRVDFSCDMTHKLLQYMLL